MGIKNHLKRFIISCMSVRISTVTVTQTEFKASLV